MMENIIQVIILVLSIFATTTVGMYLLLTRKSGSFSAWAGIFLGFLVGSIAELAKIFLEPDHFAVRIITAASYLLVAIGFIHVYRFNYNREMARQRRQKIASLVADTKTMVDPITRLANRRQFETRAQIEFQTAAITQKPISILAVRVDDFKGKYYTYGQECADEILRSIAATISAMIREEPRGKDLAARTDSDQFEILLVGVDSYVAHSIAERLLSQIKLNPLNWHNQYIHLNASIAYCSYPHSESFEAPNHVTASSAAQLIVTVEDTLERACQIGPGKILQGPA